MVDEAEQAPRYMGIVLMIEVVHAVSLGHSVTQSAFFELLRLHLSLMTWQPSPGGFVAARYAASELQSTLIGLTNSVHFRRFSKRN